VSATIGRVNLERHELAEPFAYLHAPASLRLVETDRVADHLRRLVDVQLSSRLTHGRLSHAGRQLTG
jgi:hypothetical protein